MQVILFRGEVLRLPLGALFRQGEEWAVFVATEGRAQLRTVAVGQRNSLAVEIREGLYPESSHSLPERPDQGRGRYC